MHLSACLADDSPVTKGRVIGAFSLGKFRLACLMHLSESVRLFSGENAFVRLVTGKIALGPPL
jgi:hypothetical protein